MLAMSLRRKQNFSGLFSGWFLCSLILCLSVSSLHAQATPSNLAGSPEIADQVLAKLGKQEIRWSDLAYRWRVGGAKVPGLSKVESIVVVEGVESARKQRIGQAELDRRGVGATVQEINQWIEERIAAIEGEKLTPSDLAEKEGLSLSSWTRELRWQKSWEKFSRPLVTDDKLKLHYEEHPTWFNGTECEVFHIIRPLKWGDENGRRKATSEFATLADQIRNKETTFEDAAKKWSSGATAREGGRLGWLTFQGPMHPSFVQATFALKKGEVSEPVETPHGVHLIYVHDVKAGELPFERVIEDVRRSLLIVEFEKLVDSYPKPPQLEWIYKLDNANK
jgi:hypothetical protein